MLFYRVFIHCRGHTCKHASGLTKESGVLVTSHDENKQLLSLDPDVKIYRQILQRCRIRPAATRFSASNPQPNHNRQAG